MPPKCNNKLDERDLPERTSCIGNRIKDPLNLAVTTIGACFTFSSSSSSSSSSYRHRHHWWYYQMILEE
ncbi:hypothetical protein M0802_015372 [Mischocyttarus mexicanus]|nr:hypothetical protein M0802_015372 [Mischocyttarus mexicanus]